MYGWNFAFFFVGTLIGAYAIGEFVVRWTERRLDRVAKPDSPSASGDLREAAQRLDQADASAVDYRLQRSRGCDRSTSAVTSVPQMASTVAAAAMRCARAFG